MPKKRAYTTLILTVFIATSLFIDTSTSNATTSISMESNGLITKTNVQQSQQEFLIRYLWIGSLTTAAEVDEYVSAHPWGTGIILTDVSSGILSIISYTGWNETQTWQGSYGGITYTQLKTVIDEFHSLGWKVIYSPGNTPTNNDAYIYNYLTKEHPELIGVAGNGQRYDKINSNKIMVNFFANYTTPDITRKIEAGDRLSDLYVQRLTEMITDKSFQWDGWFGVDGWNGFTNMGMYWLWSTNQPFGRWIGTNDLGKFYYCDNQSIEEWSQSTYTSIDANWNEFNQTQKINWITNNANLEWWQYWQERFAKFYAQINQIFDIRPQDLKVGSIISQDLSSTWADNGINNPVGMENLTMFANFNSFDHYYIDCEWVGDLSMLGRYSAYTAGLVKSKIPSSHCISEMPIAYSGNSVVPTWVWKQMYLAMIQTYCWNNGSQVRAVDPDWLLVWVTPTKNWDDAVYHGQEMADWVKNTAATLDLSISPLWLGPVEVQPLFFPGTGIGAFSNNFTFAQYTDCVNLNNSEANIVSGMGTIFLDSIGNYGSLINRNCYSSILDLFNKNKLNVIYDSHGYGTCFHSLFDGPANQELMSDFDLINYKIGTTASMTTVSSSQVTDPYAQWIIGDTFNHTYTAEYYGILEAGTGTVPIVKYNDGKLAYGIYYTEQTGRFIYGKETSGGGYAREQIISREVLNRGIYWASECPVNSSDALVDLKIFALANGDIAITVMNLRDFDKNIQFTLDLSALPIHSDATYSIRWQSTDSKINSGSLNALDLTLVDGADILLIHTQQ